jgi:hypothetical protein
MILLDIFTTSAECAAMEEEGEQGAREGAARSLSNFLHPGLIPNHWVAPRIRARSS